MEEIEKLISLRRENGLTQEALAEKVGVSRQMVSNWECGRAVPSTGNLKRLSELYGISMDSLLGGGEPERKTAVAVKERPEGNRWRKPALIGLIIGLTIALAIALLAVAYFTGYDEGVKDATPTYPVHTDVLDEQDCEGTADLVGW